MDYSIIVSFVVKVVEQALPLGIIITFSERLVQMFLNFAFPKMRRDGF